MINILKKDAFRNVKAKTCAKTKTKNANFGITNLNVQLKMGLVVRNRIVGRVIVTHLLVGFEKATKISSLLSRMTQRTSPNGNE